MNTTVLPDGDIQLGDYKFRIDRDFFNVVYIITRGCNFHCSYCGAYSDAEKYSLLDDYTIRDITNAFGHLSYSTGKKLYVTFTGGEPSTIKNFAELARAVSEIDDVYIELQTNLTTKAIPMFANSVNPAKVGQVMATYHEETLAQNPKLMKLYFDNFKLLGDKGFTVVLKTVAVPSEVPQLPTKIERLRQQIPNGSPILVQPFINHGSGPFELITHYPYIYSKAGKKILKDVMTCRRGEIADYINGAGRFMGMRCGAGHDFIVINNHGDTYRCSPYMTHKAHRMGNLMAGDIKLNFAPDVCPVPHCTTSFWPLWYGVEPWKYTGRDEVESRYCRYRGIRTNGLNCIDSDITALEYISWAAEYRKLGRKTDVLKYYAKALQSSPIQVIKKVVGKI